MSESLGDISGLSKVEKSPPLERIIDAVELDGDIVRLILTQHDRNISHAYVLCSLDDTDIGDPKPEQVFDIPLSDSEIPSSFEFPRLQDTFTFRMVTSECLRPGEEIHTVHPGFVQGERALVMDVGWIIPT